MNDTKNIYTEERQREILNKFEELLQSADNSASRSGQPVGNPVQVDYKQFWTSLRAQGADIFGLTNYLKQGMDYQKETTKDE